MLPNYDPAVAQRIIDNPSNSIAVLDALNATHTNSIHRAAYRQWQEDREAESVALRQAIERQQSYRRGLKHGAWICALGTLVVAYWRSTS